MNDFERKGWTSASNAQADALCPGRHLAQRDIPEPERSKDAETGTRIHAALAGDGTTELTLQEQDTYDRCKKIERDLVVQFFGGSAQLGESNEVRERRFWVKITNGIGRLFHHSGKPDVVYRLGDRALILEYKSLWGDVEDGPSNQQLRDQECLVRTTFLIHDEIGVAVIQPKLEGQPTITVYDAKTSVRAFGEMCERVIASNDPTSPREPGTIQCAHCRAKAACLEYQRLAGSQVPQMVNLLDVPVAAWTPDQRLAYWNQRNLAYKWLEMCDLAMKSGFETDPNFIPGHVLAPGRERQTITDAQTVFARFAALGGTAEQFLAAVSVGKGKLKTSIAALGGLRGKALDDKLAELIDGTFETSVDSGIIKPEK